MSGYNRGDEVVFTIGSTRRTAVVREVPNVGGGRYIVETASGVWWSVTAAALTLLAKAGER